MSYHTPVLLKEVLQYLDPKPNEIAVDGTLGGAGHSLELAKAIAPKGFLISMDLDPASITFAKELFAKEDVQTKYEFVHANYKNIDTVAESLNVKEVDMVLVDIGISSYDLESSARGFSFQKNEPLDMRYNPETNSDSKHSQSPTAKFILQNYEEKDLESIFRTYGEEKFSRRIAHAIVTARQTEEISSTEDLLNLIKLGLPAAVRFRATESARRIFQALRIEVNKELDNLSEFLPKAFTLLRSGGRLAVISFHSLEDRIVKHYFLEKAKGCVCPPDFPQCVCGRKAEGQILTRKPVTANDEEILQNSRSKPAKLRVIKKY